MPLLRSLTTKIKTKLTISPLSSSETSPAGSLSSFDNFGGERKTAWRPLSQGFAYAYNGGRSHAHGHGHGQNSSVESFHEKIGSFGRHKRPRSRRADSELSFGCVGIEGRDAVEEPEKMAERRRSKFREEF